MSAVRQAARMMMTHRAFMERNSTATTDAYGHPNAPSFSAQATIPCRAYTKTRREQVDGDKYALTEEMRCMMPIGTDVTEDDRLSSIKDRLGVVIWAGPLRIDTIQHRHTHIEARLLRVQS